MADRDPAAPADMTAGEAMNRVLAAERSAAAAVADCEAGARDIVQQAREQANGIAARTDQRITRMGARCARQLAGTLARLQAEQPPLADGAADDLDDARISACMDAIARILIGSADKET